MPNCAVACNVPVSAVAGSSLPASALAGRRRLLLAGAASLAAPALVGCSRKSDGPHRAIAALGSDSDIHSMCIAVIAEVSLHSLPP